jgi:hypothetical protein
MHQSPSFEFAGASATSKRHDAVRAALDPTPIKSRMAPDRYPRKPRDRLRESPRISSAPVAAFLGCGAAGAEDDWTTGRIESGCVLAYFNCRRRSN